MPDTPTDTSSSTMEVDNNEFGSQDIITPIASDSHSLIDTMIDSFPITNFSFTNNVVPIIRSTYYKLKGNFVETFDFFKNSLKEALRSRGYTEQQIRSFIGNPESEQLNYILTKLYQRLDGNVNVILNCDELDEDKQFYSSNELFETIKRNCLIDGNNLPDLALHFTPVINRAFLLNQLIMRNITEADFEANPGRYDTDEPTNNDRTLFLVQLLLSPSGPEYQLHTTDEELMRRYMYYTEFRRDIPREPIEVDYDPSIGDVRRYRSMPLSVGTQGAPIYSRLGEPGFRGQRITGTEPPITPAYTGGPMNVWGKPIKRGGKKRTHKKRRITKRKRITKKKRMTKRKTQRKRKGKKSATRRK